MLSEISQTEKDKYYRVSPTYGIFFKNLISKKQRTEWWLPKPYGKGKWDDTSQTVHIFCYKKTRSEDLT